MSVFVLNEGVSKQEKTVTPSTTDVEVTPDTGYLLSKVTVEGESNLLPKNIKSGVEMFGVTGNMKSYYPLGTHWEKVDTPLFSSVVQGIDSEGKSVLVGVESTKYLSYSHDGINWHRCYLENGKALETNVGNNSSDMNTLQYVNGIFFIREFNSSESTTTSGSMTKKVCKCYFHYSYDGITWYTTNPYAASYTAKSGSVTYSRSYYPSTIILFENGRYYFSLSYNSKPSTSSGRSHHTVLCVSSDISNWTTQSFNHGSNTSSCSGIGIKKVVHYQLGESEIWYAYDTTGYASIYTYSTDGVNFNLLTEEITGISAISDGVSVSSTISTYYPSFIQFKDYIIFYKEGNNPNLFYYSTDGLTFTRYSADIGIVVERAFFKDKLLFITTTGFWNTECSEDGINLTKVYEGTYSTSISNRPSFHVVSDGSCIHQTNTYSFDGITWNEWDISPYANDNYFVKCGDVYVTLTITSNYYLYYSYDLITWHRTTNTEIEGVLRRFLVIDDKVKTVNKLIAFASSSYIWWSYDNGVTFNELVDGIKTSFSDVYVLDNNDTVQSICGKYLVALSSNTSSNSIYFSVESYE